MRFFRRKKADSPSVPGASFFDDVYNQMYGKLAGGYVENVYRASLLGGSSSALIVLEKDPHLSKLWGKGSQEKAERLVEVWASSFALILFQNEPEQEALCRAASEGFCTVIFDSDAKRLYQELRAFQIQMEEDDRIQERGGIGTYAYTLLRLRCFIALGNAIVFNNIPIPVPSISQLLEMKVADSQDLGSLEDILLFGTTLATGIQITREEFDSLEKNTQRGNA